MRWPTTKVESDYLAKRKRQNVAQSAKSRAETWANNILANTGENWTRQAQWGYRIFDFWNARKGIAVEIDGPEHDAAYDAARDEYNFLRSGILVLHVKNFNETDMQEALEVIKTTKLWSDRRRCMNLKKAKRAKSGKDKLTVARAA